MPRQLRIEYPGAIYHVMNLGDHREPIFRDDEKGSIRILHKPKYGCAARGIEPYKIPRGCHLP